MLFAIDIGNSHTVSGIFSAGKLVKEWRLKSDKNRTADELAIRYHGLFSLSGIKPADITAMVISSVVPTIETSWLNYACKYYKNLNRPPLTVSHRTNTGIKIKTDNPAEVGADRIVNGCAAWHKYKTDLIVVDFGTAITFDCINARAEYMGGTIHPGIGISLDALASRTAKLPRIDINNQPTEIIGRNTVSAIHSGILYGFGGLVDRMVEVIGKGMNNKDKITTIATGGMAEIIAPFTDSFTEINPNLTLEGLKLIHELNR